MSERGSFRGGRGGGRGGRQQQKTGGAAQQEKPKKENILDLGKYMDKEVQVKFNGGREGEIHSNLSISFCKIGFGCGKELYIRLCLLIPVPPVTGTLKGYDQLMNLVLDDVKETMRGRDHSVFPFSTRSFS
jgi:U6 snRNA-associated Sm-like protein LSm7